MSTGSDDKTKEPMKDKVPRNAFQLFVSLFWATRWRVPVGIAAVLVVAGFVIWVTVPDSIKEVVLVH